VAGRAAALPLVGHRNRRLGHVVGHPDKAGDTDAFACRLLDRDQRLVVVVVDLR
jgi:hypothetical protein